MSRKPISALLSILAVAASMPVIQPGSRKSYQPGPKDKATLKRRAKNKAARKARKRH